MNTATGGVMPTSCGNACQIFVWVDDNDAGFYRATLCNEFTGVPLTTSDSISAKDIFFSLISPVRKTYVKVLPLHDGFPAVVDVPVERIYMCYRNIEETTSSCSGSASWNLDLLAGPVNLPSATLTLKEMCAHGMTTAKVGPIFLTLRGPAPPLLLLSGVPVTSPPPADLRLQKNSQVRRAADTALEKVEAGSCSAIVLSGCSGSGELLDVCIA
jgi:hypothetical protein